MMPGLLEAPAILCPLILSFRESNFSEECDFSDSRCQDRDRSCQLIGWPIPRRLPSLSLNQAPLPNRLPSLSLTSAMSLTVLKPETSYSSNTTPRPRSHSTVASMSFTSHDI